MPSLTVRRLRGWMDQPEAMGLPRDIQNLVIMGFALQGDYAFSLHGGPVEPRLERLDDELELREQPLPDEARWQEATQRLAAILGMVASPLLLTTPDSQVIGPLVETPTGGSTVPDVIESTAIGVPSLVVTSVISAVSLPAETTVTPVEAVAVVAVVVSPMGLRVTRSR